jgi:ABC-type transporter Mla MlaB component
MPHRFASADRVTLDGALTMRTADTVCARLRATLEGSSDILIDCQTATDVDLAFIQLLLAARLSIERKNRALGLAHPPSGAFLDTLTRAGFQVLGNSDTAFWFEPAVAA